MLARLIHACVLVLSVIPFGSQKHWVFQASTEVTAHASLLPTLPLLLITWADINTCHKTQLRHHPLGSISRKPTPTPGEVTSAPFVSHDDTGWLYIYSNTILLGFLHFKVHANAHLLNAECDSVGMGPTTASLTSSQVSHTLSTKALLHLCF